MPKTTKNFAYGLLLRKTRPSGPIIMHDMQNKCDKNGKFLKVMTNFFFKSSPNIKGIFLKNQFLSKTNTDTFWQLA